MLFWFHTTRKRQSFLFHTTADFCVVYVSYIINHTLFLEIAFALSDKQKFVIVFHQAGQQLGCCLYGVDEICEYGDQ